jgi:hypothetical protein
MTIAPDTVLVGGPLDGVTLPPFPAERSFLVVPAGSFATFETDTHSPGKSVPARRVIYRRRGDSNAFDFTAYEKEGP